VPEQPPRATIRPARPDELPAAVASLRDGYTAGMVDHAGVAPGAAQEKADRDFARLVPDGRPDPTLDVFVVEDDDERVGLALLGEQQAVGGATAFVYAIELDPAHRGRGLGREAMRRLEERARERGFDRIELNVFGGNAVARGLYRSLGYDEVAVYMGKWL
jgi:ribosomal protein S18 acetylase RimI-like enzyme